MCSIWRHRSDSFTITAIAPAATTPKKAAAASGPLRSRMATRSPGFTPPRASVSAIASDRVTRSA
jgi:hypothetical protein